MDIAAIKLALAFVLAMTLGFLIESAGYAIGVSPKPTALAAIIGVLFVMFPAVRAFYSVDD